MLPGGFVGVDVFFVISGYLITKIILRDLNREEFSLPIFYQKRASRIFPSLILVLFSCLIFAWFALLPNELEELGKHVASGAGFFINFILWKDIGYFDTAAELKPLLHLWSLAIEEQFYIVWPVLLILFSKKAKKLIPLLIIALSISSFFLCRYMLRTIPEGSFYSPASRFWEILIGTWLGYAHSLSKNQSLFSKIYPVLCEYYGLKPDTFFTKEVRSFIWKFIKNSQSVIGIFLIGYAIFTFSNKTPFPGKFGLLPTLGTLLIINASHSSLLNRWILSLRPLVGIGLISYPLYLWHWPLIVFSRMMNEGEPSKIIMALVVAMGFVLSILTYFLIEKPLRFRKKIFFGINTPVALSFTLLFCGIFGALCFFKSGFPDRYFLNANAVKMESWSVEIPGTEECAHTKLPSSFCRKTTPMPEVAIIGDSHAGAIFAGFAGSSDPRINKVILMGSGACQPLVGVDESRVGCSSQLMSALDVITESSTIHTVYITSYYKPLSYGDKDAFERYLAGYRRTFEHLMKSGKKVILLMDTPALLDGAEVSFDPGTCIKRRPIYLVGHVQREICGISVKSHDEYRAHYKKFMQVLIKENPNVFVYDPAKTFLKDGMYWAIMEGQVLYADFNHLNATGAKKVMSDFLLTSKNK